MKIQYRAANPQTWHSHYYSKHCDCRPFEFFRRWFTPSHCKRRSKGPTPSRHPTWMSSLAHHSTKWRAGLLKEFWSATPPLKSTARRIPSPHPTLRCSRRWRCHSCRGFYLCAEFCFAQLWSLHLDRLRRPMRIKPSSKQCQLEQACCKMGFQKE